MARAYRMNFWDRVDKNGPIPAYDPRLGPCWIWLGGKEGRGYGAVASGRVKAHRWAYERLIGPIPKGLQLDHLCRNRACVNPAHLEPVTSAENNRRGFSVAALNARKTHCKNGHPLTANPGEPGSRYCRICKLESMRKWHTARRALRAPRLSRNNTTGVKNVSFIKERNRYKASLYVNGKPKVLGHTKTVEEAAELVAKFKAEKKS